MRTALLLLLWPVALAAQPCTIKTIAGPPTAFSGDGGPATSAYFRYITGFRFDTAGNLYIADSWNQRIRKVTTDGIINTIAGNGVAGFSGDGGPGTAAQLNLPVQVTPDNNGGVYVIDQGNHRIRWIDAAGNISTVAGTGVAGFSGDGGPATAARLQSPSDLVIDKSGNLIVLDQGNRRLRRISADGTITTIAGNGIDPNLLYLSPNPPLGGPGTAYALDGPSAVVVDGSNNILFSDPQFFQLLKLDTAGNLTSYEPNATMPPQGASSIGQAASSFQFEPNALAIDAQGDLAIYSDGIYLISAAGIITQFYSFGYSDLAFSGTTLYTTGDGVIVPAGNLSALSIAGLWRGGNSGDGGPPLDARFENVFALALDPQNNIVVADSSASQLRKIVPGITISHIAGSTGFSSSGDGGPAAQASLGFVTGLGVDQQGQIYLYDDSLGGVRIIDTSGNINAYATTNGSLFGPIAVSPQGDVWVDNFQGNSFSLLSAPPSQRPPTISPAYALSFDSKGTSYVLGGYAPNTNLTETTASGTKTVIPLPQIGQQDVDPFGSYISGVVADAAGNVYFTFNYPNPFGSVIQELTPDGRISTIASQSNLLPFADGAPGTVDLGYVTALTSDSVGDLYYTDAYEHTVRELTAGCPVVSQPIISNRGVVNAASYVSSISPGEIMSIFGQNLASSAQDVPVSNNLFPTSFAGVQVTVNGVPVPLLYVSPTQINFVAPYAIDGVRNPVVRVISNGISSDPVAVPDAGANPGIFAIANADGSVNSQSNPASAGSYVVIYGTGQGLMNTVPPDGTILGTTLLTPLLPVSVQVEYESQPVNVLYAGSAPGLVAGVLQLNVGIPSGYQTGMFSIGLNIGGYGSSEFSLYVK